jgi:hypothetical protein
VESVWIARSIRTGDANSPFGIDWAQLNVTGGTIAAAPIQRQLYGNLGNDGIYRWMPSLAVDKDGNMALGYSASKAAMHPEIRYNGRLAAISPLGTLDQGETTLHAGGGSQTVTSRWGDYSAMTLDPDGCTFWYTQEYYAATGGNWQTRIGKFKYASCTPIATAVQVGRLATARTRHGVAVSWSTQTETTLLGFSLWRNGLKLGRLIGAVRSGQARGSTYRFVDRSARKGRAYTYRLQIVDLSGKRSWSGVSASIG